MEPRLSVVVCTCNHARTLAETLRCLAAQDADPATFEVVVVVENLCTDNTPAVLEAARAMMPNLRTVAEPTSGQAHARVRGVRESRAEWIAFVDDDNYLDQGWINGALGFAETHPHCGVFGGKVSVEWEVPPPPEVSRRAYAFAATDPGAKDVSLKPRALHGDARRHLLGAGLVCRREALAGTGWLDWQENVGRVGSGSLAGDDTEIVMRIARDGWEAWYVPACTSRHVIAEDRLTLEKLRAPHRGFATAEPLLLGLRARGTRWGWAAHFALMSARRLSWLARHTLRGLRNPDARPTAKLAADTSSGNLHGLGAVARLDHAQRRVWFGQSRIDNASPAPMRVLHIHSGRDYGGLERLLLCLAQNRGSAPAMEPVFALGCRRRLADEIIAAGARVEIVGAIGRSQPWSAPAVLARVWAMLGRERYAAVVCHGSSALATFGWLARLRRVPLVLWMHSDTKVRHANIVERLASRSRPDLVICNSAYTQRSLPLLFTKLPRNVVLHCPVMPTRSGEERGLVRLRLRAEQSTADADTVIILPSRLERWKGHAHLIEALGRLRGLPAWKCWIVGGPFSAEQASFLEELRTLANRLVIGERVRFLGQRADVSELLLAADLFCQPNVTPEPFGVNAVEALYASLPVIASDSGGTREIVDESCGRLTPPGDIGALALELERLICDSHLRATLAAGAPARGLKVSDPTRLIPELQTVLAALAEQRAPPLQMARALNRANLDVDHVVQR